jgi:catechol 2,3-dioxygenase-like lactoylglutathione lyase family enzyme
MATETTTIETKTAPVKFHISLNVSDLDKSVDFYRLLFGCEPAKCRKDYAKFESEDPQLVLSLEPNPRAPGGALNHLGLRLADSAALVAIQQRFEAAGIRTRREEGVECCYALQTKFWVTDPDRNLWELYLLHEDLEHRGIGQTLDQMLPDATTAPEEAPPPRITWEHTLGQDLPSRLPPADATVNEVRLVGTFNAALPDATRDRVLSEVARVLKPAGKLFLHTLVGDRSLAGRPNLPGPAAFVEAVPVDKDLLKSVEQAGFVNLEWEKYDRKPCFIYEGVSMRESKLWAQRPDRQATGPARFVLYKGPLKQVIDDGGTVFPRGERVPVDACGWAALQHSPVADRFVFFAEEPLVTLGAR